MSLALYTRRLFWDGAHGCAKAEGIYRSFSQHPNIRGIMPFDYLDFAPEVGTALITPRASQDMVRRLISNWAISASDNNPTSLYLQFMAAKEFGIPGKAFFTPSYLGVEPNTLESVRSGVFHGKVEDPGLVDRGTRAFLREMYNQTQADLAANGIKDAYLFRGSKQRTIFGVTRVQANAMTSFSASYRTARNFSGMGGANSMRRILVTKVPAFRILSTPRTGFGCLGETEVVVLGGRMQVVAVHPLAVPLNHWSNHVAGILREREQKPKKGNVRSWKITSTVH